MLTEFGGIAYVKCSEPDVEQTWGYSAAGSDEEFALRLGRLLEVVTHTALFSGFCYTQFADTFQEANGLLCADRTPKLPLADIARLTTRPRSHIAGGV
jgi:hypothetical protein